MKNKRKIVHIDEEKCDGCGLCVPSCQEGAIQIIDGKARLVAENLCDGLGDCLGECPQDAITIEEREAEPFDEKAVEEHLQKINSSDSGESTEEDLPCGCPSSQVRTLAKGEKEVAGEDADADADAAPSFLRQWPVQLALLPPKAKFLQGAPLLIAADCAPFAYGNFHRDFIKGNAVAVGCPKLDDTDAYLEKLVQVFRQNEIEKVTVVIMEVPCCGGLQRLVEKALDRSGKEIPAEVVVISPEGEVVQKEEII